MQFLWPFMLWFLLVIPALVAAYIWSQRRRKRFVLRYSSLMVVREAATRGQRIRRHIPAALFLAAVTAMIVALARPVAVVSLPSTQATVILTIDVSGSMRTPDLKPNRIEAAKAAARDFVEQQSVGTRIGVVAFSGTASIVQMPTTDHEAVLAAIKRLYLERSTAIGSGILASLNAIYGNVYTDTFGGDIAPVSPDAAPTAVAPGAHIPAIVILLTDGANVQGPSPVEAAEKARDLGVRVFTVGVGSPGGARASGQSQPPPGGNFGPNGTGPGSLPPNGGFRGGGFRMELDETLLKQVAETTDGAYYRASDSNALSEIYRNLNTELIISTQRIEVSALVAAAAGALVLASMAFSLFWFNRLP